MYCEAKKVVAPRDTEVTTKMGAYMASKKDIKKGVKKRKLNDSSTSSASEDPT